MNLTDFYRLRPLRVGYGTLERLNALVKEQQKRSREDLLAAYTPYKKQKSFHNAGKNHRERLLMAGNQVGKTTSAAFEVAMHLTGNYPHWWQGKKFTNPVRAWAAGVTASTTRDNPQRVLLGNPTSPNTWGQGAIPKRHIVSWSNARGIANALDSIHIRHVSGGLSTLMFKSYEQGREKWQGETLDMVWFDEEPPMDIYMEGLTRTNVKQGIVMMTFTPLMGMSDVVNLFLHKG